MKRILQKYTWLAGASLLAIVLGSGDANADFFEGPGGGGYVIPTTGYYDFKVAWADGGGFYFGGAGAVVGGELFFEAGDELDFVVGGGGGYASLPGGFAGSGGGGSFVFRGNSYLSGGLLFAAGGGAGAFFGAQSGSPGEGYGGHPAGPASYGGGGGFGIPTQIGSELPAPGQTSAQGGSFPNGGAGECCYFGRAASGGYGGGGGAGYDGGGGGGGAPGGFAGGYSYVINTARNAFGITGGNGVGVQPGFLGGYGANGYVSINFVAAPEPSTWAMTLTGFAGLGWLARLRRRKLAPI
jgi:hypothetical protein